jgi:hypothetical protein
MACFICGSFTSYFPLTALKPSDHLRGSDVDMFGGDDVAFFLGRGDKIVFGDVVGALETVN